MDWQQWTWLLWLWLGGAFGFLACAVLAAGKQADEATRCIECHEAQQQEREAMRQHLAQPVSWQTMAMIARSEGEDLPRATEAEQAMSIDGRGGVHNGTYSARN